MSKEVLAEQIAQRLRRSVLRGELPPGASIKERDIAETMGVSRTPIREAIRVLAQEGLVALRPSRSPIVAIPDLREVEEQTVVLIALEKLSAKLACRNASDQEFADLGVIVAHISDNYEDGDTLDIFEADMSFHMAIAEASANRSLAETHATFLRRLWRARYLAAIARRNRERIVDQHGDILAALCARDEAAAEAAIDNHLWRLAEDIRAVLAEDTAEPEAKAG